MRYPRKKFRYGAIDHVDEAGYDATGASARAEEAGVAQGLDEEKCGVTIKA